MVTTIQVQETTKQLLDRLKSKNNARSYDELLQNLLAKQVEVRDMFGATKDSPVKFTREDKMKFHEL